MSPDPGSRVSGDNVLIAVSLIGISNPSAGTVQILLDGVDITDDAYIDTDLITCNLENLNPGAHRVDLVIEGIMEPTTWDFSTTIEERVPLVDFSGRIRTSNSMDRVDDQTLSINKVNLNFKGSLQDWLDLNANIKLTSQENELYQPRNILGFSLGLKDNLKLNFGDSNPRISRYTIDGKRMRGFHMSMRFWWFNFQFVNGELNRSVQGQNINNAYNYSIIEQNPNNPLQNYDPTLPLSYIGLIRSSGYTFERNLTVLRYSFGRERTMHWGVTLMKAKDDTNSVVSDYMDAKILYERNESGGFVDGLQDSVLYTISQLGENADILSGKYWEGTKPKDNIVFSNDIGMNLFQKRFRAEAEIALSLTNNDIWGGAISLRDLDLLIDDEEDMNIGGEQDLSSLPDPADFEDFFILNENLTPFIPIDPIALKENGTSPISIMNAMPGLAYRARVITNISGSDNPLGFGNYLAIEVNKVGSEFNSLANPYLIKNKKGWSITDKVKLLQNRLMLSLSFKHQDDDLLSSVENIKSQNTLSFGMNAIPGPNLPTVNFSFSSVSRDNGITDITILDQDKFQVMDSSNPDPTSFADNRDNTSTINYMFNLNHRFFFNWNHSISGTFVFIKRSDEFKDRFSNFLDPSMATSVMNVVLTTRYDSPLQTSINLTTNSSELSTGPDERGIQDFLTTNFGAEYPFFKNKLLANTGLSYAVGSGMVEMSWLGLKGGLRWRIVDGLSINAQGEYRLKETAGISKNTVIARANLEYAF
ncbi:MAG: hypothetical protein ACJZ12_03860 [Candidatus Neomarinimicrobiota bacterium]